MPSRRTFCRSACPIGASLGSWTTFLGCRRCTPTPTTLGPQTLCADAFSLLPPGAWGEACGPWPLHRRRLSARHGSDREQSDSQTNRRNISLGRLAAIIKFGGKACHSHVRVLCRTEADRLRVQALAALQAGVCCLETDVRWLSRGLSRQRWLSLFLAPPCLAPPAGLHPSRPVAAAQTRRTRIAWLLGQNHT